MKDDMENQIRNDLRELIGEELTIEELTGKIAEVNERIKYAELFGKVRFTAERVAKTFDLYLSTSFHESLKEASIYGISREWKKSKEKAEKAKEYAKAAETIGVIKTGTYSYAEIMDMAKAAKISGKEIHKTLVELTTKNELIFPKLITDAERYCLMLANKAEKGYKILTDFIKERKIPEELITQVKPGELEAYVQWIKHCVETAEDGIAYIKQNTQLENILQPA